MLTATDVREVTLTIHTARGEIIARRVPLTSAQGYAERLAREGVWESLGSGGCVFHNVVAIHVDAPADELYRLREGVQ